MASKTARPSNSHQKRTTPKRSAASTTQGKESVLLGKSKKAKRAFSDSLSSETPVLRSKRPRLQKNKGDDVDSIDEKEVTETNGSWAGSLTKPLHHFATATQLYAKSQEHLLKQQQLARELDSDKQRSKPKRNRKSVAGAESVSENASQIKKKSKTKQAVSRKKSATAAVVNSDFTAIKPCRGRKVFDMASFLASPVVQTAPASAKNGRFTCTLCGSKYYASTSLVTHMKVHKQTLFSGKCQCGQKFYNSVTFLQHCLLNHPTDYQPKQGHIEDQSTSNGKNPKQFKCDVCGAVFIVAKTMEKHRLLHTQGFQCTVCSEVFTLPRDLKNHMNQHLRGNQMNLRHPGYWASFKESSGNRNSASGAKPRSKSSGMLSEKVPGEEHSETVLPDEERSGTEQACPCLGNKPELVCFTESALGSGPDKKKIIGFRCKGCSKVFRAMQDFLLHVSVANINTFSPSPGQSYLLNTNSNGNINSSADTDRNNMADSSNSRPHETDDSDAVGESFDGAVCTPNDSNTLNNSQGLSSAGSQDGISFDLEHEKDTLGPDCTSSYRTFVNEGNGEGTHILPYGVQVKMEPAADNLSSGDSLVFQGMEQSSHSLDASWARDIKMEQSSPSYQVYFDTALETEKEWASSGHFDGDSGGGEDSIRNSGSEMVEECNWEEGSKQVKIELNVNWSCDSESHVYGNESNEIWQISVNSDDESVPLEEDVHTTLVSNQGINLSDLQEYENKSQAKLWKFSVKCEEDAGVLDQGSSPSNSVLSENINSTSYDHGQALTSGDGAMLVENDYESQAELLRQSAEPDHIIKSKTFMEPETTCSSRLQTSGDHAFSGNQHPDEETRLWVVMSHSPMIKQEPIAQDNLLTSGSTLETGDTQKAGPWCQNEGQGQSEPRLPATYLSRNETDSGVFPVHLFCNAQTVQPLHDEQNQVEEAGLN